jgi:hypothetical protein
LCFQTNGTQPIHPKNFETIEKFHLVKLHISLDGVGNRFEYLRWPANWRQVTDNILDLRKTLPGNVMFVIEETVSIFNLLYINELESWVKQNFTTNREGDVDVDISVIPNISPTPITITIGGIRIIPSIESNGKILASPALNIAVAIDSTACSLIEGRRFCARLQSYMNEPTKMMEEKESSSSSKKK